MTETDAQWLGRLVIDSPAEAVIHADRGGVIRFWNAGAERLFGYRREEALGQSLDIIIPETLRQRHWRGYQRVMVTGASRYAAGDLLAVPALHKDGRRISLEFTVSPTRDANGALTGIVAVLRDVTDRWQEMKSLRQRLARLEEK
jgi:PAS domain S-box-containing protein